MEAYAGNAGSYTITNNAYWNYGSGSIYTNGSVKNDANPTTEDPQLSCWAVQVLAGSPVFNSPVSFPDITGGWGPPGFVVPQTGTAPSWPTTYCNPPITDSFSQAISGLSSISDYQFGTAGGNNVTNVSQLGTNFGPYGIAGNTVINQQWQIYNFGAYPGNFANDTTAMSFQSDHLALVGYIPGGGGLHAGGINSGQITTNATFAPSQTGHDIYAFDVLVQIPGGPGGWTAPFWIFTKDPACGSRDASEQDVEFFQNETNAVSGGVDANSHYWTGFQHGPGSGSTTYNLANGNGFYTNGTDYAAGYHDYQMVWTPDSVYKYIDGVLISRASFTWTSGCPGQVLISNQIGTSLGGIPGVQPTSTGQFPFPLNIKRFRIWGQ